MIASVHATSGRNMDFFHPPPGITFRAAEKFERRVVIGDPNDPTRNVAYLFYKDPVQPQNRSAIRQWPSVDPDYIPALTVGLDRGGVGAAGSFFAEAVEDPVEKQKKYCFNGYYDKFHRVVRCIRNTLEHVCNGAFLQMIMFTSHIWSLNYKPHNKGFQPTKRSTRALLTDRDDKPNKHARPPAKQPQPNVVYMQSTPPWDPLGHGPLHTRTHTHTQTHTHAHIPPTHTHTPT